MCIHVCTFFPAVASIEFHVVFMVPAMRMDCYLVQICLIGLIRLSLIVQKLYKATLIQI
jgi:hypothetical protein